MDDFGDRSLRSNQVTLVDGDEQAAVVLSEGQDNGGIVNCFVMELQRGRPLRGCLAPDRQDAGGG